MTTPNDTHRYWHRADCLLHCKLCNGGEGSLPVNCPGRIMTAASSAAVMAGEADFVHGVLVRAQVFSLSGNVWRFVVGDALDPRVWRRKGEAQAALRLRLRALQAAPGAPRSAPEPQRPGAPPPQPPWAI